MSKLRLTLNNSWKRPPIVARVLNSSDREEIYPSPKYHRARSVTFELTEGFYESSCWCDGCNREVRRFFAVRSDKSKGVREGTLWGSGITDKGAEWICDQVDKWQIERFPKSFDAAEGAPESFIAKMPKEFWDTNYFIFDGPPPNPLWTAIKTLWK